jgi:hypothetical protein
MLSAMQYPHWMIVAGAILVMIGFVGVAFQRNRDEVQADERPHEAEADENSDSTLRRNKSDNDPLSKGDA